MLDLFHPLGQQLLGRAGGPRTESWVSGLHYRATTVLLLGACTLVCASSAIQYISNGAVIHCKQAGNSDNWAIPADIMNTYCYIMGTFTLPPGFKWRPSVHPGVGVDLPGDQEERHLVAYYQPVSFTSPTPCSRWQREGRWRQ